MELAPLIRITPPAPTSPPELMTRTPVTWDPSMFWMVMAGAISSKSTAAILPTALPMGSSLLAAGGPRDDDLVKGQGHLNKGEGQVDLARLGGLGEGAVPDHDHLEGDLLTGHVQDQGSAPGCR